MNETRPPLIGITTYRDRAQMGAWDTEASYLPAVYIESISRAGGVAVLLPPQPAVPGVVDSVLAGLDGLIVSGGQDVDPARYGQQPHPKTDAPSSQRDEWEEALLNGAIAQELPFLGVCRGAQLLNVALGGTLHQHLPEVIGSERYSGEQGVFKRNEVVIDAGSLVAEHTGAGTLPVLSYHHQAIDEVAGPLTVTARTAEGVVQAVELPELPFAMGVQWHPEQDLEQDLRLFEGLIAAAREHRAARG